MKKLSIIIPIYNVEKYIRKCLQSCVRQNIPLTDYEIIVVNDGTPDNSMQIVEEFANSYENIKIINQTNQGLSMARNNGFIHAQGEYVWFVDSDDYIEENCLGRITSQLKNNLDILQLQYRLVYEDNTPSKDVPFIHVDAGTSGIDVMLKKRLPAPAQFCIYRSSLLREHDLRFVKGIYHEDAEFKPRAVYFAKKVCSDTPISYNYLQRCSGSIMSSFKLKNGLDIITVMNNLYKFVIEHNLPKNLSAVFWGEIGILMNAILRGYSRLYDEREKETLRFSLMANKHLFSCMMKSNNFIFRIDGLCMRINVDFGLKMYTIRKKIVK